MAVRAYQSDELTVTWNSDMCIHSGICAAGLRTVFRPTERPWVDVNGAGDEEIASQVERCPSHALGYFWHDATRNADSETDHPAEPEGDSVQRVTVRPTSNGPYEVVGPVQIVGDDGELVTESEKVYLCRCGQSRRKPFCDGSHTRTGFRD